MVKSCLKKSIGREKLSFTGLLTVLLEVENVLNNRPFCILLCIWCDVTEVLTLNYLLYGSNLDGENKVVEEIDFGVIWVSDLWERKCVEHFWLVWYREYLDGIREQRSKCFRRGAAEYKLVMLWWLEKMWWQDRDGV